jgi:hypothetical protein
MVRATCRNVGIISNCNGSLTRYHSSVEPELRHARCLESALVSCGSVARFAIHIEEKVVESLSVSGAYRSQAVGKILSVRSSADGVGLASIDGHCAETDVAPFHRDHACTSVSRLWSFVHTRLARGGATAWHVRWTHGRSDRTSRHWRTNCVTANYEPLRPRVEITV